MGYEDRWLQTVATGLGRALGFSEPPTPTASKDPQEEHLSYQNWRLETSNAILEMGVSNNQKWGPPQYFWMKGRDWIIQQVVKHLTPKALAGVLRMEEERRQPITTPRAILSQPAQRPEYVEAPPPYEEVMGTRRRSGEPTSAPYIDEWLSWGKGATSGRKRAWESREPSPKGGQGEARRSRCTPSRQRARESSPQSAPIPTRIGTAALAASAPTAVHAKKVPTARNRTKKSPSLWQGRPMGPLKDGLKEMKV